MSVDGAVGFHAEEQAGAGQCRAVQGRRQNCLLAGGEAGSGRRQQEPTPALLFLSLGGDLA